ncbi:amino acid ABC transporter permease [Aureimonas sp. ME7]|uniref:amino acid ABC transporter permease n=1 Tax=Aureimonas sp. ME7 TaxID=2744252 RepID=UPI0015F47E28|nr:amino acid ABC transporter permease [Aureimonas sp. ME7]
MSRTDRPGLFLSEMNYRFHFQSLAPYCAQFVDGLLVTIRLASLSLVFGLLVAAVLAFARVFGPWPVRRLVSAYTETFRNTPFLVQLFMIFFGLPTLGLRLTPFGAGLLALVLNSAAYLAEILRAGIVSLPKGQIESARVLGMGPVALIRDILLAQVVSRMYPALCAQMNVLVLNTSVASAIAVDELTGMSMIVASNTYRSFEVFSVMALVYLVLTLAVAGLLRLIGFWAFPWKRA